MQLALCLADTRHSICIYFLMFAFERECVSGEGTERGRRRIQSRLRADSSELAVGLELTNREIMARAKVGH